MAETTAERPAATTGSVVGRRDWRLIVLNWFRELTLVPVIIVLMMMFRPTGLIPERRRKREIEEATHGPLDEPLYEMREADEPGAGERGSPGRIPRG